MLHIKTDYVWGYAQGNVEDLAILNDELSYSLKGAFFMPQTKKRHWSGRVCLGKTLSDGRIKFPIGLLSTIKKKMKTTQIEISSLRTQIPFPINKKEVSLLDGVILFPHQKKVISDFQQNPNGILQLPVRSGKTLIGAYLAAQSMQPTLYVIPSKDLLVQTVNEFQTRLGITPGRLGDGAFQPGLITIAIINSLVSPLKSKGSEKFNILKDIFFNTRFVIYDECHLSSKSYQTIRSLLVNCCWHLGLSATPLGGDRGQKLNTIALCGGNIISKVSVEDMVAAGRVAKPKIIFLPTPQSENLSSWESYPEEYQFGIVENRARNREIAETVKLLRQLNKSILILVEQLDHGRNIQEYLTGFIGQYVTGSDAVETRRRVLKDLQMRKLDYAIGTRIWNQGIDVPALDCIINAGGYKGTILTLQKYGRPLTKREGKDYGLVIDFLDDNYPSLYKHAQQRQKTAERCTAFDVVVLSGLTSLKDWIVLLDSER
jgi:superfamily II DNA or RNA helicase